jgi:hypothetical protein
MDEVAAYERRLAPAAGMRNGTATSPQLAEIFQGVAARRARRTHADAAAASEPQVRSIDHVARDIRVVPVDRPTWRSPRGST